MDYTLKIDEAHIAVLVAALEMYGRVGTGEFSAILKHPDVAKLLQDRNPAFSYNARNLLDQTVKGLVCPPEWNAETSDTSRMARETFQVLHRQIASHKLPSEGRSIPDSVQ